MTELEGELKRAIQAAELGQALEARQMLLAIVDQHPQCAPAWVWLSRLLTKPRDQIIALEMALKAIPPGTAEWVEGKSEAALWADLQALYLAHPQYFRQPIDEATRQQLDHLLTQAHELAQGGLHQEALRLARQVLERNPRQVPAWRLISQLHPDRATQAEALERILALRPDDAEAQDRLAGLGKAQKEPLKRGQYLEESGRFEPALEIYQSVIVHSRSAAERIEAQQRIKRIRLLQESHTIQPVNPDLNLLRLTIGPVLLYLLVIFLHSGLNFLRIPLLAYLGLLGVIAGSLIIAATDLRPLHARWVALFGRPGRGDEPHMREGMRALAWVLILMPAIFLLVDAWYRLRVLTSALLAGMK